MNLIIRILVTIVFVYSSGILLAAGQQSKVQSLKTIRADILSTITSINEIRLIMINSELKGDGSNSDTTKGNGKTVTRLTTNVTENNKVLKELRNEALSNDIRLSILEKATFSKAENNFNDYITSTSQKIFNIKSVQSSRNTDCDPMTDTYTYNRTQNYDDIDIVEKIVRHDISGKVCFERDVFKRKTPSELLYLSSHSKVYNDYPVNDIATYTNAVTVLTSSMEKGKSFGGGGMITYESNGTVNTLVYNKVSTLLNEDAEITLLVNQAEKTYLNCLIIGTRSNSTVSTEWYCPGDGLVKRIIFYPSVANKASRSEIITLNSITAY